MVVQLAAMLLLGQLVHSPTRATGAEPAAPVLVLLHHSVWFSSVDRPWFILYDDGTVIYPKDRERQIPLSYQRTRIVGKNIAQLLDQFDVQNDYWRLDSIYDFAPMVTDQETVFLLAWDGSRFRRVAVRAALEENGSLSQRLPPLLSASLIRYGAFTPIALQPGNRTRLKWRRGLMNTRQTTHPFNGATTGQTSRPAERAESTTRTLKNSISCGSPTVLYQRLTAS